MEAQHTPGPWHLETSTLEHGDPHAWITASEDGGLKDGRYMRVSGCIDIHDANLIAAAPELLQALTQLYDAVDSCVDLTPEVLQQARAAINKANGQ